MSYGCPQGWMNGENKFLIYRYGELGGLLVFINIEMGGNPNKKRLKEEFNLSLREKFENDEEICMCPRCEIIDEYTEMILDAENEEEIRDLLEEMFDEVEDFGFANALKCDIDMKLDVLKDMGEIEEEED